jgi:predicted ABC-type ATPase
MKKLSQGGMEKSKSPKIRLFAGPNGSGKSSLFELIKQDYNINFGSYINADLLLKEISEKRFLDFSTYHIQCSYNDWSDFFKQTSWAEKISLPQIRILDNVLVLESEPDTYLAALLADFLREQLLKVHKTFTFESVMSHPSKISFLEKAQKNQYRTYLYFVATENPFINRTRIQSRVLKGGHDVGSDKIDSRYKRTLELLPEAVQFSNRAFIFDNSLQKIRLIAEITDNERLRICDSSLPVWFKHYFLDRF